MKKLHNTLIFTIIGVVCCGLLWQPAATAACVTVDSVTGDGTYAVGYEITFTVAGTGGGTPYTYKWAKGGTLGANYISGATASTYTIASATTASAGSYYGLVFDSETGDCPDPAVSSAQVVVIVPAINITTPPSGGEAMTEGAYTFTVVAADGITPYTYAWLKNGTEIVDATTASYTRSDLTLEDTALYMVEVADANLFAVDSIPVQLTVSEYGGAVATPVTFGGGMGVLLAYEAVVTTHASKAPVTTGKKTVINFINTGAAGQIVIKWNPKKNTKINYEKGYVVDVPSASMFSFMSQVPEFVDSNGYVVWKYRDLVSGLVAVGQMP